ncbi:MAG: HAMP domain-containing protein [Rhizobiales bacterium]|nr:HAMP domain-containing protein [Hyphomicrobiales bacterium]
MSVLRNLTLRICLIIAGALLLILLVIFGAIYVQNTNSAYRGFQLPLPDQVSAMVEYIEKADAQDTQLFLRAINSSSMHVHLLDVAPDTSDAIALPNVTRFVSRYLDRLGGRHVYAMVDISRGSVQEVVSESAGVFWAVRPVRLLVELKDGRILAVEVTGELFGRLTGLRLALLVLHVTLLIGGVSLWAVQRQIKPLQQLARAVDVFGAQLEIAELPDKGAKEVRQLISAVERMQARIRDLVNGRMRILAAIGHDLGTYLTRLRLRAEFIADETQRESAIQDIEDMHALMSDTLTLAKADSSTEIMQDVDLVVIVQRQADSLMSAGESVRVSLPEMPLVVLGRPVTLGRLVGNLLTNALKYGKVADVSLVRCGDEVRLAVADRGPGIPPEDRAAVLEPFFRHDQARNLDAGGFGLGLAIVAEIVQRAGGRIAFEDRPGGGLIVNVDLPLRQLS